MYKKKTSFVLSLSMIFLLVSAHAYSMWAKPDDGELAAGSDIVALAELIGRTGIETSPDGKSLYLGILKVEAILKGDKQHKVLLLILPSPSAPRKSDDIIYQDGQKGIWLLNRSKTNKGLYHANHPGRFIPETDKNRVNELLNQLKQTALH